MMCVWNYWGNRELGRWRVGDREYWVCFFNSRRSGGGGGVR